MENMPGPGQYDHQKIVDTKSVGAFLSNEERFCEKIEDKPGVIKINISLGSMM
jgi:hypothetical protein